jgi:hypothetical protein
MFTATKIIPENTQIPKIEYGIQLLFFQVTLFPNMCSIKTMYNTSTM